MKPDIVVDTRGQSRTQEIPFHESLAQMLTVMDLKTLSGGEGYRNDAEKRKIKDYHSSRCGAAVTARGKRVHGDYVSKATALDKKIAKFDPGAPKCVTCVTQHQRILGPVVGPYAEVSSDFLMLWNFVAAAQTNKALARSRFSAGKWKLFAVHKFRLVQRWGLFFHRGWARLLDARITELFGTVQEALDPRGYSEERREQLQAHFFLASIHADRQSDVPSPDSEGEEEDFDTRYTGGAFLGTGRAWSS